MEHASDALISMVLSTTLTENDVLERTNGPSASMSVTTTLLLLNKSSKKVKRDPTMTLPSRTPKKLKGEGMRACGLLMMKSITTMVSNVKAHSSGSANGCDFK